MRKGEANDISWTIVLWAATVAAIISRLTLLFPWRRYGRAYKSTQTPEGKGGGRARRGEREGCRPYGAYTQTTHTLTWNTTTTTRGEEGEEEEKKRVNGVFTVFHETGVYARHPQKRTL